MWKSPNCASQHTRELGLLIEKPSSNPSTAYSDRELLQTVYGACLGEMLHRGLEEEGQHRQTSISEVYDNQHRPAEARSGHLWERVGASIAKLWHLGYQPHTQKDACMHSSLIFPNLTLQNTNVDGGYLKDQLHVGSSEPTTSKTPFQCYFDVPHM